MRVSIMPLRRLAICGWVAFSTSSPGQEKQIDPSGTWTWPAGLMGGGSNVLVLKLEHGSLTGTLQPPIRNATSNSVPPTPALPVRFSITNATLAGDTLAFMVIRPGASGQSSTNSYTGKITGDKISGQATFPARGETNRFERTWTATKLK